MMQSSPPPILPPTPPVQVGGQRVTVVERGAPGAVLYSARDVAMLEARRSELSNQLESADGRRHALQKTLQGTTGADRAGLEQRLGVLDARIARIESDIEENGRALASPAAAFVGTEQAATGSAFGGHPFGMNVTPLIVVLMLFVLAPIAIGIGRRLWRRGAEPHSGVSTETAQRLERMEQAMDAIAVEVERVSEGQRFVTRLLSEGRVEPALAADHDAREPARLRRDDLS